MFCSIVLQMAQVKPRTPVVIIYLHIFANMPLSPFIFFKRVPLPKFGFLAHGVYLVPPLLFPAKLRHCGTLKVFKPYLIQDLGIFPAVNSVLTELPWLIFSPGVITTCISAPCEHGLSSAI